MNSGNPDPVPTPVSALDAAAIKSYDDMTPEERAEYDRLARKREEQEQAGPPPSPAFFIRPLGRTRL